jgi:transcriptional regulator with XRE-family HTH domain
LFLKQLRLAAGLTLRDVADKAGVSHTFVTDIEKNRNNATGKVLTVYRKLSSPLEWPAHISLQQRTTEAMRKARTGR